MKFRITFREAGRPQSRWMRCQPTCSPLFVVHFQPRPRASDDAPHRVWRNRWSVSHKRTGLAIAQGCTSIRQARALAGALAGVPLPWHRLTYRRAMDAYAFYQVPKPIQDWLQLLRRGLTLAKTYNPAAKKAHGGQVSRDANPARSRKAKARA